MIQQLFQQFGILSHWEWLRLGALVTLVVYGLLIVRR